MRSFVRGNHQPGCRRGSMISGRWSQPLIGFVDEMRLARLVPTAWAPPDLGARDGERRPRRIAAMIVDSIRGADPTVYLDLHSAVVAAIDDGEASYFDAMRRQSLKVPGRLRRPRPAALCG